MRIGSGAWVALCVAAATIQSPARAEPWAAASGLHGGGLGMDAVQSARLWTDVGFFTRSGRDTPLGTIGGFSYLSPIFGLGVFVGSNTELEGILPVGARLGDNGATGVGDPYVGLSYIMNGPGVHLKVGGGIAFPVLDGDNHDQLEGAAAGLATGALQEAWLYFPDALSVVVPIHIEAPLGTPVLFVGDAAPFVAIPVRRNDETNFYMQLAPGVGIKAGDGVVLGARFPIFLQLSGTGSGDRDQTAIEPFIRFVSESVFFSLRFTIPIDEPLGFAFDSNRFWGLHAGLGVGF